MTTIEIRTGAVVVAADSAVNAAGSMQVGRLERKQEGALLRGGVRVRADKRTRCTAWPVLSSFNQVLHVNPLKQEIVMNTKALTLAFVAATLSGSVFAGQPNGRDSVYAEPGGFPSAKSQVVQSATRPGRGSVFAADLPAPTPKDAVKVAAQNRPGRA